MKRNESKYKQVVNHVIEGINNGSYKKGDWILSINEFRKNYNLSRDTVFAGLSELKSKGIIDSTPGVGYYIATTRIAQKLNIFLLFNEFNEFKEDLYNSFISSIRKTANVDLYFHNYNRKVFETLINEANYKYTTYILMPGKFTNIAPLLESLSGRVFLLDHFHPELAGKYSSVAQNFEKDTYEALVYGLPHLKKYEHIIMVQKEEKEPIERYNGLCAFCEEYHSRMNIPTPSGTGKSGKGKPSWSLMTGISSTCLNRPNYRISHREKTLESFLTTTPRLKKYWPEESPLCLPTSNKWDKQWLHSLHKKR